MNRRTRRKRALVRELRRKPLVINPYRRNAKWRGGKQPGFDFDHWFRGMLNASIQESWLTAYWTHIIEPQLRFYAVGMSQGLPDGVKLEWQGPSADLVIRDEVPGGHGIPVESYSPEDTGSTGLNTVRPTGWWNIR